MTRWMAFAGIALAAVVLSPTAATACSCVVPEPMDAAPYRLWLDEVDAVFLGKVIAIEKGETVTYFGRGPVWWITFQVDRRWRGVTSLRIVVHTPVSSDSCGVEFELNRTYVVAAHRTGTGLYTGLCDRFYVEDERAFRSAFGEGSPPPKR